ncbi:peroxiredoxin-like family protein [Luteolibacter marinus]|uniref:peroxiredoxin-like family protein n=1 Tax=Luteolibacter marinus TaxID=2776705 RepID=UPI001868D39D|nr:peroxiredoxin-like family protein [Luteolibacter marinus]
MKWTLLALLILAPALSAEPSLQEQLDARSAEAAKSGDPAVRAAYARGIDAVAESGILDRAKKVGDKAPDFTLEDAAGKAVQLSTLWKDGPVILTWYRGGWCPYCNIALAALQEKLPEFRAAGARLVALTPELPDKSLSTKEKNHLEFEVLTDLNHRVAKNYGIAFELTPEVRELYKKHFNLTDFNGKEAGEGTLPLAATYIIGRDGVIRWAFVDSDYRKRAEPDDIVAFLKKDAR